MYKPVHPFSDVGIATLSEVLDPIALTKHLRVSSLSSGNGGAVEEVQVRMLQHHPKRRCTAEIGLRAQNGWHFMIGKVYHKDRPDVFQAMEGIQHAGFGPHDEFSIPRPLAYLPTLRLLLLEKVDGPMADQIFKTGNERSRAATAERCARWLARFHAVAPKAGEALYPHGLLSSKSMRRCARKIAERGGCFVGKAAQLLEWLDQAASSVTPGEMCAGHASYSAAHVILAQDRTVVFDWDGHDLADPARDVGRFLAALRRLALGRLGSIRALDEAAEVFLHTYLAVGQPEVKRNLHFYEAAACLKLAKYNLCHPVPHWQEKAEAMLDEGLRVLEQEVSR